MRRLLVIPLIIAYLICAAPYFICGVLQFWASVPIFVIEGINNYLRFDSSLLEISYFEKFFEITDEVIVVFVELMKGGK